MMKNKRVLLIVLLLLVASFLVGSSVAKKKYGGRQEGVGRQGEQGTPTQTASPTLPPFVPKTKSAKPEVKFFVMSFCPFGNQAEAGLEPVYQLLKDKVSWQPRYIVNDKKTSCEQGCPFRVYNDEAKARCEEAVKQSQLESLDECKQYFPYQSTDECLKKECAGLKAGEYESLHGVQELNQDVREICAFNLNNLEKWWKFVVAVNEKCTAQNADTCWEDQATAVGLDIGKITLCFNSRFKALAVKEIEESAKYQASGSPTVYINDTLYNGGRSPEDYKKAICAAFENPPEECQKVLSQESTATNGGCN